MGKVIVKYVHDTFAQKDDFSAEGIRLLLDSAFVKKDVRLWLFEPLVDSYLMAINKEQTSKGLTSLAQEELVSAFEGMIEHASEIID